MARPVSLDDLKRHAIARSLFTPTTLPRAMARLGFVQADPIRAPARAQDLTLRHRVAGYCAGDLEARYPRLALEEDFFINYGFLPRATQALMHPRSAHTAWPAARQVQAQAVLDFVRERGVVHPRDVDLHFQHGSARNWFGGNGRASTQLLDGMHYRGLLRVARRDSGVRLYAAATADNGLRGSREASDAVQAYDQLAQVVVQKYAPLPERTLAELVSRIRYGAPQWAPLVRSAVARAKALYPSASIDGQRWYWPAGENPASQRYAAPEQVRLLAPFDPVVWCRRRFEAFWGWAYRFEAYTPAPKRLRGYYALPLLWRSDVIGWANLTWRDGQLTPDIGYVNGRAPREAAYRVALDEELQRMTRFLAGRSAGL